MKKYFSDTPSEYSYKPEILQRTRFWAPFFSPTPLTHSTRAILEHSSLKSGILEKNEAITSQNSLKFAFVSSTKLQFGKPEHPSEHRNRFQLCLDSLHNLIFKDFVRIWKFSARIPGFRTTMKQNGSSWRG